MEEYILSEIRPSDRRSIRKMEAMFEKEGIERDKNLDYTVGLYDEEYNLLATGSCFGKTLRCMAVDSNYQGKGLLNLVVTHLVEHQYNRGNLDLFLYTKCDSAKFFEDLNFHEIARVQDKLVFMENRREGFSKYSDNLAMKKVKAEKVAAAVVNANPFTLGHQYLLEKISEENDIVHIFVVSEDASLVPFSARYDLVKKGTAHLDNLIYHNTGEYLISTATFPSYFLKDEELVIESHARLDIEIFKKIAESLGVTRRYVGEEPFSKVTNIYNRVMKKELGECGIECVVIPRKENENGAISASKVRSLIHDGRIEQIRDSVPQTTYDFFVSTEEGMRVVDRIRNSSDYVHY
ncbi:[citrate (pro-3S)-lyase] ligase [Dethiosulfatibacter aminovorans DSM 17477]|uniref:[Citrate [pro-3S]-lyase] ligase n=1 Tax=Dethiosulfatibacter aminovorans DSM 17477 TaxID=1121476 RepID=A0A1M6JL64_9FIRM|nr:[citrate (pro-3S)-lyase] ligase [Dethiosulfatibacter aminovorans]SHJ47415.1 [citrate (pro-3S)-lyase] ligase [Dethiosulfatibacter aminovorans DSM 17477]